MITLILILVSLVTIVFTCIVYVEVRKLTARFNASLGGSQSGSIEDKLASQHQLTKRVSERLDELNQRYHNLTVTSSVASQKISIVRYNPFGDTGGDQSFSLAALDAHDSGYIITSIHGRTGTRVYIKPVDFGKSKHKLSEEELQAVTQAISRIPQLPEVLVASPQRKENN